MPLPSNDIRAQLAKLRSEFAERAALNSEYEREMASKYIHQMIPFEEWLAMRNAQQGKAKGGKISEEQRKENLRQFLDPSKIKDRLYHVTPENFKQFKPGGKDATLSGPAIWLSPNKEFQPAAHRISYRDEQGKTHPIFGPNAKFRAGTNVMPVHVQSKNPLVLDDPTMVEWAREVFAEGSREFPDLLSPQTVAELKKEGYDSIIHADPYKNGREHEVIMFHPNQIKSAIGNRGTYDPNNPDITKASGGSIPSQDVMRLAIGGQGPKNWLKGSVEQVIEPLKSKGASEADRAWFEQRREQNPEEYRRAMEAIPRTEAINQWIQRNLANYIKKQMATHDDPIRKLAEQGILHIPVDQIDQDVATYAKAVRRKHDAPRLGQSPEAQAWEDATDVSIYPHTVADIAQVKKTDGPGSHLYEPWMDKADPETKIWKPLQSMRPNLLGFDHLVDILKEDLAQGRIRPEQLSKVSIEQAVRRAHEYDQERKKAMAETALKATEGMPVHKDYGDGFKWIELALPKDMPEGWTERNGAYYDPTGERHVHPGMGKLADALKYEGDTMGHCVGGYCPDVAEGRSRIFSLRDAKNEPHVTIEVQPKKTAPRHEDVLAEMKKNFNLDLLPDEDYDISYEQTLNHLRRNPPLEIKQIKGKGNAKPKKDYIPYVQDFVKSGKWSDVGDIRNAEMVPVGEGKYVGESEAKKHFEPRIKKALDFLQNHPAFKEQHAARAKRDKDLLSMDFEDQRKLENIYGQPLYPKSGYSANELLRVIQNPEDHISNLNDYYPSLNSWLNEAEKGMAHYGYTPQQKARGGEVDAEEVFMGPKKVTHAHHLEIEERKL